MGEILAFGLTKKAIYRAAVREMERFYRLSAGEADPLIAETARDLLEMGEIEAADWRDWNLSLNFLLAVLHEF